MAERIEMNADMTLAAIREKAALEDSFIVKVVGKLSPTEVISRTILTLARATVDHIVSPEAWISALFGGGDYALGVFHASDPSTRIGIPLQFKLDGAKREMNLNLIQQDNWPGPKEIKFAPNAVPAQAPAHQPATNGYPAPVSQTVPMAGGGTGVAPAGAWVQPQQPQQPFFAAPLPVQQYQPQQAPAQPPVMPNPANMLASAGNISSEHMDKILSVQRDVDIKSRELAAREADLRAEKARSETEAKLRVEFEAKLREMAAAQKPAEKAGPSLIEIITAVTAAAGAIIVPLVSKVTESSAEARRESAKLQADAAARIAEMQKQQTDMLMAFMNKPTNDNALVEMMKVNNSNSAEMLSTMMSSMSTNTQSSIAMMTTMAELTQPPEGSPVADAVKEAIKMFAAMAASSEKGAKKMIQNNAQAGQPRQLPAQAPRPAQAQAPAQVPVQQFQKPAPAASVAPANETKEQMNLRLQAELNAKYMADIAKQQSEAAAAPVADPVPGPIPGGMSFDDLDAKVAGLTIPPVFDLPFGEIENPLLRFDALLKARTQPVEAVAEFLVQNINGPEFTEVLEPHQGNVAELAVERYSDWFAADLQNVTYLQDLGKVLEEYQPSEGDEETDEDDDLSGEKIQN